MARRRAGAQGARAQGHLAPGAVGPSGCVAALSGAAGGRQRQYLDRASQRVAEALDHRIEWLVGEEDPWSSEEMRVAELYRSADGTRRRRVMEILSPDAPSALRAQRICLIGLRGAGKSTLGRLIGEALGSALRRTQPRDRGTGRHAVDEVMALYGPGGLPPAGGAGARPDGADLGRAGAGRGGRHRVEPAPMRSCWRTSTPSGCAPRPKST
jgi:hypothetical protein